MVKYNIIQPNTFHSCKEFECCQPSPLAHGDERLSPSMVEFLPGAAGCLEKAVDMCPLDRWEIGSYWVFPLVPFVYVRSPQIPQIMMQESHPKNRLNSWKPGNLRYISSNYHPGGTLFDPAPYLKICHMEAPRPSKTWWHFISHMGSLVALVLQLDS